MTEKCCANICTNSIVSTVKKTPLHAPTIFTTKDFSYVSCLYSKLNHSLNVHLNLGLFSEFIRVVVKLFCWYQLKHNLYGVEFMCFIIVKHLAVKIYARV